MCDFSRTLTPCVEDDAVRGGFATGEDLMASHDGELVPGRSGGEVESLTVVVLMRVLLLAHGLAKDPEMFAAEFEPHIAPLTTLTLHPIGVSRHPIPMDATLFIRPSGYSYAPLSSAARKSSPVNGSSEPAKKRRRSDKKDRDMPPPTTSAHNVDGHMMQGDVDLVGADVMIRSRIHAAQALGCGS